MLLKSKSAMLALAGVAIMGLATADAGVISYTPFSGDSDCGVSSANTYTAAVQFTTGTPASPVNGVQFTNVTHSWPPPLNTTTGMTETAVNGDLQFASDGSGVSGSIGSVMNDISYNNSAPPLAQETFVLTGLTTGTTYDLRLYVRQWSGPGTRVQNFSFTGDGVATTVNGINEDDASTVPGHSFASNQAYYMSHVFTYDGASSPGVVVTATDANSSFHDYGLTNQVVVPEPGSPGLLGLAGLAMLRRRARHSVADRRKLPVSNLNLRRQSMRCNRSLLFAAVALLPLATSAFADAPSGYQWTQVWGDDFNSGATAVAPDSTKWDTTVGAPHSQEAEYYSNSLKNVYCQNGVLHLVGLKEDTTYTTRRGTQKTLNYTSGEVTTLNKYAYKYGKIEVRAKVPTQSGSWPAIWSMGTTGVWPVAGETDIMEYWASQGNNFYTTNFHWQDNAGSEPIAMSYCYPPAGNYPGNGQFHTYGEEWDATAIRFYYDGNNVANVERAAIESTFATGTTPFDNPNYMLLNLALGDGGGAIPATFVSQDYQIDFVHISQLTLVPEPGALSLLALGVPSLLRRFRRR